MEHNTTQSNTGLVMDTAQYNTHSIVTGHNVQGNTVQHDTTQYNTIHHSIVQHDKTQYNTIHHSIVQHDKTQYNTMQQSTVQHSTVQWCTRQISTIVQLKPVQCSSMQYNCHWRKLLQLSVLSRQTNMCVATNACVSRQNAPFIVIKVCLSWQTFCRVCYLLR